MPYLVKNIEKTDKRSFPLPKALFLSPDICRENFSVSVTQKINSVQKVKNFRRSEVNLRPSLG